MATKKIYLKIHFETKFGEYLAVTGDIEQLGNWKEFTCKLKWNEGHIWTTEEPIETDLDFFQYKYVVLHQNDVPKKWESGFNRIADLNLLAKEHDGPDLEVHDHWNQFDVTFQVCYPFDKKDDQIFLCGIDGEEIEMT